MNKAFDVDFLKTQIIPLNRRYCRRRKNPARHWTYDIPLHYVDDLSEIVSLYGAKLKLANDGSSGVLLHDSGKVTLRFSCKTLGDFSEEAICQVFTHEVGHLIQFKFIRYEDMKSLRKFVNFERVAERMGYFIAKEYFPHFMKKNKLTHRNFSCYRAHWEIRHLYEHHLNNNNVSLYTTKNERIKYELVKR